ncbi:uncharacterized protein PHACADRAFT_185018 [Phanerochaete carnosa HHB-10118-sp]|uniref:Uncharacterized protein n=1 Tax=Phanerochaete carnosa (strain HHB-10118-sp) TaxID=650164 RepID=K5WU96_PHACS|nr:uncharacterized protein PHACADRAFT_185018 [Phanerochaete carnosa HHB-10118-sp]EKM54022.1 hypothetical protein PHACADRAFT_185018 [Phanerochaete carnosa HHB-10118-sp]
MSNDNLLRPEVPRRSRSNEGPARQATNANNDLSLPPPRPDVPSLPPRSLRPSYRTLHVLAGPHCDEPSTPSCPVNAESPPAAAPVSQKKGHSAPLNAFMFWKRHLLDLVPKYLPQARLSQMAGHIWRQFSQEEKTLWKQRVATARQRCLEETGRPIEGHAKEYLVEGLEPEEIAPNLDDALHRFIDAICPVELGPTVPEGPSDEVKEKKRRRRSEPSEMAKKAKKAKKTERPDSAKTTSVSSRARNNRRKLPLTLNLASRRSVDPSLMVSSPWRAATTSIENDTFDIAALERLLLARPLEDSIPRDGHFPADDYDFSMERLYQPPSGLDVSRGRDPMYAPQVPYGAEVPSLYSLPKWHPASLMPFGLPTYPATQADFTIDDVGFEVPQGGHTSPGFEFPFDFAPDVWNAPPTGGHLPQATDPSTMHGFHQATLASPAGDVLHLPSPAAAGPSTSNYDSLAAQSRLPEWHMRCGVLPDSSGVSEMEQIVEVGALANVGEQYLAPTSYVPACYTMHMT